MNETSMAQSQSGTPASSAPPVWNGDLDPLTRLGDQDEGFRGTRHRAGFAFTAQRLLSRLSIDIVWAFRTLFADTTPSHDWLRNAARLVVQVGIVVVALVALNQVLLLALVGWFGDTMPVRTVLVTVASVLYAAIYHATSVRQKRIPAAWSGVALVILELTMVAAMFPLLVLLVQALFPAAFLKHIFEGDWQGPAILILVVFVSSRGWARYMLRATQAAKAQATADVYERLAFEDSLTGLANRRKLEASLDEWLRPAALANHAVSLLLIDVDQFKAINDSYSHNVGDAVLRQLAHIMRACLASADFPARLAGDEFVVVLRGHGDAQARDACIALGQAVSNFNWHSVAEGLHVSISIGCARAIPGEPLAELLRRSDEQMYMAKRRQ